MQQLHLVGITTEMDGLIFSGRRGARTGNFVIPINEELVETITHADRLRREAQPADVAEPDDTAEALRRLKAAGRPESRLTPREMQARLRAGQSVGQVARAAGVPEEWVDRWAAPIVAEQERILEMAFGLTASNPRSGRSAMALSESVRINLHERGVPLLPEPEGWSARNLGGGRWAVRFEYVSRGRRQAAEWDLDLDTRELTPGNRLAADIGHVGSARRRVPAPPPVAPEPSPAARKAPTRRAPVRKAAGRKAPATRQSPSTKKAPATKRARTAGRSPAAKKAPARKARAGKKGPARKAPVRKAPARKRAPVTRTASRGPVAGKKTPVRSVARKRTPVAKAPAARASRKRAPARRAAPRRRGR